MERYKSQPCTPEAVVPRSSGMSRLASNVRRAGEPLWLASVGTGPQHVLVIAGAHASEAVGLHAMLALAWLLA
jgi:hypothetical protein